MTKMNQGLLKFMIQATWVWSVALAMLRLFQAGLSPSMFPLTYPKLFLRQGIDGAGGVGYLEVNNTPYANFVCASCGQSSAMIVSR